MHAFLFLPQFTVNTSLLYAALIYWVAIGGLIGAIIGMRKNKVVAGFLAGVFLNVIGWILMAFVVDLRPRCFNCGKKMSLNLSTYHCKDCDGQDGRPPAEPHRHAPKEIPSYVMVGQKIAGDKEDMVYRLIRNHRNIQENLEVMKSFPKEIENEMQWKQLNRVEKYFSDNLKRHFDMEENVIFPRVLEKYNDPDVKRTVDALMEEHKLMRAKMDEVDELLSKKVFPLHKNDIDEINLRVKDVKDMMLAHAGSEDDKIFALDF